MLKERIFNELGRAIGTTVNAKFWADNFGCHEWAITKAFDELRSERRIVERDGLLYRS